MIKSIFYSKFDVREGPKVVHQVPDNSVTAPPNSQVKPLLHFPSISSIVIPRQSFCGLPLSVLARPYRILTHPVRIVWAGYERNEFIFSFSLVLHHRMPTAAYGPVVDKLARLFEQLERESRFLSGDRSPPNHGRVFALCEILLEDLNNYCETMIPVDDENTLNIKLFPAYPPPPRLWPHHVPLPTIRLSTLQGREHHKRPSQKRLHQTSRCNAGNLSDIYTTVTSPFAIAVTEEEEREPNESNAAATTAIGANKDDENDDDDENDNDDDDVKGNGYFPHGEQEEDTEEGEEEEEDWTSWRDNPSMQRILPHVDGVKSLRAVARAADAEYAVVRAAVEHLCYYGCAVLLDLFSFGATYAPTADAAALVAGAGLQNEARAFVLHPASALRACARAAAAASAAGPSGGPTTIATGGATADKAGEGKDAALMAARSAEAAARRAVEGGRLVELYFSFRQGQTLRAWVLERPELFHLIDVRKLVVFGVLKGILYRVHKYAIAPDDSRRQSRKVRPSAVKRGGCRSDSEAAATSVGCSERSEKPSSAKKGRYRSGLSAELMKDGSSSGDDQDDIDAKLERYLDGNHSFDEMCTELGFPEKELLVRLKAWGDVQIIHR